MTNAGTFIGFTIAGCLIAAAFANGPRDRLRVVDGDTVAVGSTVFRLVGFDAPETGDRARCRAESDLGDMAKQRLEELIATTDISIEPVACACRPGTEGTKRCNFGRQCSVLKSNGVDVAAIMIGENLARPYVCSGTRCPRRRSWCVGAS